MKKPIKKRRQLKQKDKAQFVVDNTPLTAEQIRNREAVKRGLFAENEMIGAIDCFRDDFQLLFVQIDTLNAEKRIGELNKLKIHYQHRFDISPLKISTIHQHGKLFSFIDDEIEKARTENILNKIMPSKTVKANKDLLLNEVEIAILFRHLQMINVIQSNDTNISKGINIMTGWGASKLRNLLVTNKNTDNSNYKSSLLNAVKKLMESIQTI